MDVNNHESIRQAAITVDQHFGRLDVLINNAGVYLDEDESLLTMAPAILEKTMETNFLGLTIPFSPFCLSWKNTDMEELLIFLLIMAV